MKYSVRTDFLFPEYPIYDAVAMAKDAGADAIEFGELNGVDVKRLAKACEENQIRVAACGYYNMWDSRLGRPYPEIRDNLEKTIECAKILGTQNLLSLADNHPVRDEKYMKEFVENMKPVVEICEKNEMLVLIEPHNTKYVNPAFDFSQYYLNTSELGYQLIREIGSEHVRLLFDFFHIQTMEGDVMQNVRSHIGEIAHFHLAGTPDRDEVRSGELNYRNIVNFIEALGYEGYVGLEYYPTIAGKESLRNSLVYLRG